MTDTYVDISIYLNDRFEHRTVPLDSGIEIQLMDCPNHDSVIQLLDSIIELGMAPSNPQTDHEIVILDKCLYAIVDLVDALKEFDALVCFQQYSSIQLVAVLKNIEHHPHNLLQFIGRQDQQTKLLTLLWEGVQKGGVLHEKPKTELQISHLSLFRQPINIVEEHVWLKNLYENPKMLSTAAREAISICKLKNKPVSDWRKQFRELK